MTKLLSLALVALTTTCTPALADRALPSGPLPADRYLFVVEDTVTGEVREMLPDGTELGFLALDIENRCPGSWAEFLRMDLNGPPLVLTCAGNRITVWGGF